jgi:hypothetical protein
MAARKKDAIPILRVKKGDSLKTIYAKARKAFTAADLQKYTVIEEGIPAEMSACKSIPFTRASLLTVFPACECKYVL